MTNCRFGLLEKGYKYPCSLECPADGRCIRSLQWTDTIHDPAYYNDNDPPSAKEILDAADKAAHWDWKDDE